jgi:hypothetical protein
MSQSRDIINLQPQHRERAMELIVRAFRQDSLARHLTPDPGRQDAFVKPWRVYRQY